MTATGLLAEGEILFEPDRRITGVASLYATFWTSHFVKNAASGSNRSAQSSPPDNPAAEWQTSIWLVLPAYVLTPTTYPTYPGSYPPFVPSYEMSVHDPRAKLP